VKAQAGKSRHDLPALADRDAASPIGPESRPLLPQPGKNRRGASTTGAARDPERTRAAILAAATREFAAHGFGSARVDAIADRAQINKRMLYHYFGNKEDLYLAVLEDSYRGIRSAERKLHLEALPPEEGMRRLVTFTWEYFLEHPEFLSLLNTENLMQARHLRRSKHIEELHSPLVGVLPIRRRCRAALHHDRLARFLLPVEPLDAVQDFRPRPAFRRRARPARSTCRRCRARLSRMPCPRDFGGARIVTGLREVGNG
jgi:AcrR family transcriptional regulator